MSTKLGVGLSGQGALLRGTGTDASAPAAKLIVISGLPGTGKSTIAEQLGAGLGIPVFAKDWLEAALLLSGAVRHDQLGRVGYELLTTLAQRQLALGQSAILDSVASSIAIRTTWMQLANDHGADFYVIECICSDPETHRRRIEGRTRSIPGWHELAWADVERTSSQFAPWNEHRVVLDSMDSPETNIAAAFRHLAERPAGTVHEVSPNATGGSPWPS